MNKTNHVSGVIDPNRLNVFKKCNFFFFTKSEANFSLFFYRGVVFNALNKLYFESFFFHFIIRLMFYWLLFMYVSG